MTLNLTEFRQIAVSVAHFPGYSINKQTFVSMESVLRLLATYASPQLELDFTSKDRINWTITLEENKNPASAKA